jgi:phosphoribosylformylglycinamidine synthase I
MTRVPAIVIAGPGTNRDADARDALELAGADVTVVLASELIERPSLLSAARLAVVAGGFSHADALGAGRMLALDLTVGLADELHSFVDAGHPMIGICNGFQVLTRAGLLPGALGHNVGGTFDCRWVELAPVVPSVCVWTRGIVDPIHCPIAHGEGRYVHPDPASLAANGQIALRYCGRNPNGSVGDIAGVCDTTGAVMGLMPHPENHIVARQHPLHRRASLAAAPDGATVSPNHLGLQLFQNGVQYAEAR